MILVYALIGFVLGVPVNALADALPERRPMTVPAYLAWRGRAGARDVAVHVVAAAVFAVLWAQYGSREPIHLVLVSLYTLVLLTVTVTDIEHRLIPDRIILPAILIAALATPLRFGDGWPYALLGGACGYLFFLGAYWLGARVLGRGALGFGDVKLGAFVGLISGFPQVLAALVVGLFAGGMIGVLLLAFRRATLRTAIPYGPFIVLGGFYAMVWGAEAVRWYASNF